MFTKKQKLIALIFFILSLGVFVFSFNNKIDLEKEDGIIKKENEIISEEEIKIENKLEEIKIKPDLKEDSDRDTVKESFLLEENHVTINVFGQDYFISLEEGESVYEVMKKMMNSSELNFSFGYKEYSGMGIFVDEINGIKGKTGAYWIYYINDKEANVGVSKQILKSGDVVTWKQK